MSIEIDDLALIKHERDPDTGATKEIRSVYNIAISEKRRIVEHRIPGMKGNVLQDLGREPVRISFDGIFHGETAKDDLRNLRAKFKAGEPVSLLSNLSDIAEVTKVLIEELNVVDLSSVTNTYKYSVVLREYAPPQEEEEESPTSQQQEAEEEAQKKSDEASESAEPVKLQIVDPETEEPLKNVPVRIVGEQGEYSLTTDENGYVEQNLEPGRYKAIAEAPGYEKVEQEFVVPGSKEHTVSPKKELVTLAVEVTEEATHEPIKDATVRISGDKGDYTLRTDGKGVAEQKLEPGSYAFTAEALGYKTEGPIEYEISGPSPSVSFLLSRKRRD